MLGKWIINKGFGLSRKLYKVKTYVKKHLGDEIIKTALITGVTGQDGAYLAKFLIEKGYNVVGTYRRISTLNFWRIQHLDIINKMKLVAMDLSDQSSMISVLSTYKPDEVYNLAAQSFVGASFEQPISTGQITGIGVTRLLDAIKVIVPHAKFYQASSSEMFGKVLETPQKETTPFNPRSPYAAAKCYAHHISTNYRGAYKMFTCNGILFNHESPLRGLEFVTRKITNSVAKIKLGLQKGLKLGNIEAKRDWGFAPEYVKAMWMMLQHDTPDDYVVATGETHTVKEFVEIAFNKVGLNYQDYVQSDKGLFRPSEVDMLLGDPTKAREVLGWKPEVKFDELINIMVKEDLNRWEKCIKGDKFPWDAVSHVDWEMVKPQEYHKDTN